MRYSKGDRVRVKRFDKRPPDWTSPRVALMGKVVTIGGKTACGPPSNAILYWIEEDHRWAWVADDFEPKSSLPIDDPNTKFRMKKGGNL